MGFRLPKLGLWRLKPSLISTITRDRFSTIFQVMGFVNFLDHTEEPTTSSNLKESTNNVSKNSTEYLLHQIVAEGPDPDNGELRFHCYWGEGNWDPKVSYTWESLEDVQHTEAFELWTKRKANGDNLHWQLAQEFITGKYLFEKL